MKTVLTLIIVTILAIPGCRRGRVKQHGTNVNMETVVRTNSDNSYRGIPVRIGPNRWENCSESDDIEKLEYWYKDGKVCANEYLVGSEELYEVFIKRSRQRNHSYWSAFAQGYKDGKQEIRQKQLEEEKIEQEIAQKAKIEEENNRLKNYGKTTEYWYAKGEEEVAKYDIFTKLSRKKLREVFKSLTSSERVLSIVDVRDDKTLCKAFIRGYNNKWESYNEKRKELKKEEEEKRKRIKELNSTKYWYNEGKKLGLNYRWELYESDLDDYFNKRTKTITMSLVYNFSGGEEFRRAYIKGYKDGWKEQNSKTKK